MSDSVNANDYQFAEDLTLEDHSTLDGNEYFVMFDDTEGKKAKLSEMAQYLTELPIMPTTDGTYKLQVTVVSGTPTLSWVSAT